MTEDFVKEIKGKISADVGFAAFLCFIFFVGIIAMLIDMNGRTMHKLDQIQQQCAPR